MPALLLVVFLVMFILFEHSRAAQLVLEAQLAVGVSPLRSMGSPAGVQHV